MIKKRRNLFIMLVVIVLVLSATVGAIVASSNETRFNNTILASSVAAVSSSCLLTVTNQYQGIPGKTTKSLVGIIGRIVSFSFISTFVFFVFIPIAIFPYIFIIFLKGIILL